MADRKWGRIVFIASESGFNIPVDAQPGTDITVQASARDTQGQTTPAAIVKVREWADVVGWHPAADAVLGPRYATSLARWTAASSPSVRPAARDIPAITG